MHQSIRATFQFGINSDETSQTKRYALASNPAAFKKQFVEKETRPMFDRLMARLHGHALTRVDQKVCNQSKYMRPKFMLLERWVHWLDEVPAQSNVTLVRAKRA